MGTATPAHREVVRALSGTATMGPGLACRRPNGFARAWGWLPVGSASGPRGQARPGPHLVVVKVAIDGEPVSPDPLGLARRAAPGPPLDHTGCVALGPHQLWDLLILQGLCREKGQGRWVEQQRQNCPSGPAVWGQAPWSPGWLRLQQTLLGTLLPWRRRGLAWVMPSSQTGKVSPYDIAISLCLRAPRAGLDSSAHALNRTLSECEGSARLGQTEQ